MACITIPHYIPIWATDKSYPHMRKIIQGIVKRPTKFGLFGSMDLLPRKTHYSSLNIISVDDPRQYQDEYGVGIPMNILVPRTREQAELIVARVSEMSSSIEQIKAYNQCIKAAFPAMMIRSEDEREFADLYSVDITFIDQNGVSLVFLNKEEAQRVVDMIKAVL